MGPDYTPDVDTRLRKEHHVDKADPNAGKADSAQRYYEGLVADNSFALDKIDAKEREALAENASRAARDTKNSEVYAAAKIEIHKKFSRERYQLEEKNTQEIADLNIAMTTDEGLKVEPVRAESMRKADAAEKAGVVTHAEAERARTLATFNAEKSRTELNERNVHAQADLNLASTKSQEQRILMTRDEAIRQAEAAYTRGAATFAEAEAAKAAAVRTSVEQQKALEASRTQTSVSTLQIEAKFGGLDCKVALIQAQAAADVMANQTAQAADLSAHQLYADRKAAIEANMKERIAYLRTDANQSELTGMSDACGAMTSMLKKSDGEQSAVYKTMFAAQMAFAIASAIVVIQTGVAKAAAAPWPLNLAGMASAVASTASIVGTISGTSYGGGRENGGDVVPAHYVRFREKGKPKMLVSGCKNYLLPGDKAKVVSNADMQSGAAPQVVVQIINNHPTAQVTQKTDDTGKITQYVISELTAQVSNKTGTFINARKNSTNVRGAGF